MCYRAIEWHGRADPLRPNLFRLDCNSGDDSEEMIVVVEKQSTRKSRSFEKLLAVFKF
jgi:hypothetical protein